MYEVGAVGQFEAAHRLRGNFGPATRQHGHTYRVELVVRGDALQDDGTLCDIGQLQAALSGALGDLNYQDLGELAPFAGHNSTAERVAAHLVAVIKPKLLGSSLRTISVRVWESPTAFASCEEPLG